MSRALLYARTVRHLRPSQAVHRVRLLTQRAVIRHFPRQAQRLLERTSVEVAGWPQTFTPLDALLPWPSPEEVDAGELTLLGEVRALGVPEDWGQHSAPQLWRYHLHYWDWAWGLIQAADRPRARTVYERLLTSWMSQTRLGDGDAWSPYVVALRAWSWCGQYDALVRGSDADADIVRLLGLHAGYLRANLELDVGGNHLIKDLKALIGLAVFFGDDPLGRQALSRLEQEVARQVLPDGGQFERAPAYHCQVLADLIDVQELLSGECPGWLAGAVERMRSWLGIVLLPDGTVPLLNDGYPVPASLLSALRPGPPAEEGLTLLADTGLAVLRQGTLHVLADVGLPCPYELPAHAHADTLGFLCYTGQRRLVGESGTSTYEAGPARAFERSTAAHSTVEIDGADSTEVWGAFRAARRARPQLLQAVVENGASVLSASHDGYRRLPGQPVHTRTWRLTESSLRVTDEVTGEGEHDLVIRLYDTPSSAVHGATVELVERTADVAVGWQHFERSTCLEHTAHGRLPWRFEVELVMQEAT